ncbi:MAG: SDR family NAD(P)-dependent oxidoreductase [Pirellulaceae bacterium]|nr:SDR family NAD(P)-dependent oxidoreductase [Pirellulaceae bacterium]
MSVIDQFLMKHEVAVVTGAGGGLGSELAKILASAQAIVVLVDRDPTSLQHLAEDLRKQGRQATAYECDVTDAKAIQQLINKIDNDHGRLDALINCAGILGADDPMFEIEASDWDAVMNVNLKATWQLSTYVTKYMIGKQIDGRIVNISSSLGGRAQRKRIHYATSKAGVEHLTRNMAMELVKDNIRVNCLAPGWLATPMVQDILNGPEGATWRKAIPMGRAADPHELTGALLLLASKASSYMTGTILRVDGGYAYRGIECGD